MPFPSLSRLASSKADREDGKIKPPKQLAKAGIPLYILKKSLLQGDDDNRGGRLTFRPQAKKPGAKKDGDEGGLKVDDDDGAQEQEQEHAAAAAAAGPEFEVEIHSYGTMSRGQRREMLDLVEANMKPMYVMFPPYPFFLFFYIFIFLYPRNLPLPIFFLIPYRYYTIQYVYIYIYIIYIYHHQSPPPPRDLLDLCYFLKKKKHT